MLTNEHQSSTYIDPESEKDKYNASKTVDGDFGSGIIALRL